MQRSLVIRRKRIKRLAGAIGSGADVADERFRDQPLSATATHCAIRST